LLSCLIALIYYLRLSSSNEYHPFTSLTGTRFFDFNAERHRFTLFAFCMLSALLLIRVFGAGRNSGRIHVGFASEQIVRICQIGPIFHPGNALSNRKMPGDHQAVLDGFCYFIKPLEQRS